MIHRFRRTSVPVVMALSLAAAPALAQDAPGYFDRPVSPPYCEADDDRVEVLLLGSYHMSNPGADAFNLEADDVLAPRRQGEIADVVDRLAGFEPTSVAVEAPWNDSTTFVRRRLAPTPPSTSFLTPVPPRCAPRRLQRSLLQEQLDEGPQRSPVRCR